MRLIVNGPPGAGKTTLISEIINQLHSRFSLAGLITLGEWHNAKRSGYTLINVANGEHQRFAETYNFPDAINVGRYFMYPCALTFGLKALADISRAEVVIIDEVGRWELSGAGWFPALQRLTVDCSPKLEIWGVGEKNVVAVQARWPRRHDIIIQADDKKSIAYVTGLLASFPDR